MIDLIDLTEIRLGCSDLPDLQALVKQLVARPFRFFRVSYGDELRLHLGDLIPYANPRMRARSRGSYVVGAPASTWVLFSATRQKLATTEDARVQASPGVAARKVDIKTIETESLIQPNAIVTSSNVDRTDEGFSLQLQFSDGSMIYIRPTPSSDEVVAEAEARSEAVDEAAISDWEILTPHHRILTVGPGPLWSYSDSSVRRSV